MNIENPASKNNLDSLPEIMNSNQNDELISYVRLIRKRIWSIIFLTLVAAILGWSIANSMPNLYRSTSTIVLESNDPNIMKFDNAGKNPFGENIQTQIEIMQSESVVMATIMQLKLWEQEEFDPRKAPTPLFAKFMDWSGIKKLEKPVWDDKLLAKSVYNLFLSKTEIESVTGSRILKVHFTSMDPELTAHIVNTWIKVYLELDKATRFNTANKSNIWVESRAEELQKKVKEAELALQQYREKNSLVNIRGATQSISTKQMEELSPNVISAKVKLTEIETAYKEMKTVKGGDFSSVSWVMSHGNVPDAKSRETSARFKVAELSQQYGYEHPKMIQAKAELAEAKDNLDRQISIAVASLTREYETAKATLRALELSLAQEKGKVQNVNRIEFELEQLERNVEINQQLYDMFLSKGKEIDLTADYVSVIARVIDEARPNYAPFSPNKSKIILASIMLGLFGAIGLALGIEFLDNTVKGPQTTENKLNLPVIASIPKDTTGELTNNYKQFLKNKNSIYGESISRAQTGLLLASLDKTNQVIMICSSMPEEGKTTVAKNLALSLSMSYPTLLIECDLRRPRIGSTLGLPNDAKGIIDFISGQASESECIHSLAESNLRVMPLGSNTNSPLEIFSSERFEAMIKHFSTIYRFVILDTPPVEVVSDAIAIAKIVPQTLFILRAEDTTYALARNALKKLERSNTKVIGLIINDVDMDNLQYYYGEYPGYDYKRYVAYYNSENTSS